MTINRLAPLLSLGIAGIITGSATVSAQTLPSGNIQRIERDRNLRQQLNNLERNQIDNLDTENPKQNPIQPDQDTDNTETIHIKEVEIEGISIPEIESAVKTSTELIKNKNISLKDVEKLRNTIRKHYRDKHLLAIVSISLKKLNEHRLSISIVEARMGEVLVDPTINHRLKDRRAIGMIYSAVHQGSLLRLDKLTSAVLKINDLGAVKVHTKLQRGTAEGSTNVILIIEDGNQNSGFAQINNETNRFLGDLETELTLSTANNAGIGEVISIDSQWWGNAQGTGNLFGAGTLILPLTSDGLKLNLYGNTSNYRLLQELYDDNINGNSTSFKIGLKQPLWRRPKNSLWAQLDGEYNTYTDRIDDIEIRYKKSKVARLSFVGQHQDAILGTGLNTGFAQFSYGELDRSGNEFDFILDDLTADTHGNFSKVYLLYNRYQIFSPRWQAKVLMQGQAGFNNLDGAEKISIGYPNGVRAYPPGEGAGDSGVSGQAELIYRASPLISFSAFIDGGYLWRWNQPFQGSLQPNEYGLAGTGLGIQIGVNGEWLISAMWAVPIGDNLSQENGLDVDGYDKSSRLWASLKLWF
jgi:hemolysin activation/secretion protein